MDNPLIWQIFLGIVVLAALVLGAYSVRTWRPWDIVAGFLVFFAALGFFILAALSLHTRRTWLQQVAQLESRYETLREQERTNLYGIPTEVPRVTPSLSSLRSQLARLLIDRGRVWRDTVPGTPAGDGTVPVTITADAGTPHPITERMVLYAFREAPIDGRRVPVAYVGEFQVASVTDTAISLRPSRQLTADQLAQLSVGEATWSLYEKMPTDSHLAFSNLDPMPRSEAEGQPAFGEVDEEAVRAVFTAVQSNLPAESQMPADRLEETINQFVRDGTRAAENDAPEAVQLKVRFDKEHQVQVDQLAQPMPEQEAAGGDEGGPRKFSNYFNPQGLAEAPALQRPDDDFVTIRPGTVVVLHQEAANQLIRDQVATLIEPVYVRPLTDFTVALNTLHDRLVRTLQRIEAVRYNTATLQGAKEKIDRLAIQRQQERANVEADLTKVKYELEQLTALGNAVAQQREQLRRQMVGAYNESLRLADYLRQAQEIITEQVERSVADAARR